MIPYPISLVKKFSEVMKRIERIPKNGHNSYHNYDYVTEADLAEKIRKILTDVGLIVRTTVLEVEKDLDLRRAKIQFDLVDVDTGEFISSVFWGEGKDSGDKGLYKAYTGAEKYFLMKTFLIPTGDDPERDEIQQAPMTPKNVKVKKRKSGEGQKLYELAVNEQKKIQDAINNVVEDLAAEQGKQGSEVLEETLQELYATSNIYDLSVEQARDVYNVLKKKLESVRKAGGA